MRQPSSTLTSTSPHPTLTAADSKASWTRAERHHFTAHLATLMASGIPIHAALGVLGEQHKDSSYGEALSEICRRISEGQSLSRACLRFPQLFSTVDLAMVKIGEELGLLDQVLGDLAKWQEFDDSLYRRLKASLSYPVVILLVTGLLTTLIMTTALPQFLSVFADLKAALPWNTRLLILLSSALSNPGLWLLSGVGLFVAFDWLKAFSKTESGGATLAEMVASLPVIGDLVLSISTARYASALAMMLEYGGRVDRAVVLAAEASQNPSLIRDAQLLVKNLEDGQSVSSHLLRRPEFYHPILPQMLAIGEETSRSPEMARWAVVFLEETVEQQAEALSVALEPAALLITATVVGFIVISVLMPLYNQLGAITA